MNRVIAIGSSALLVAGVLSAPATPAVAAHADARPTVTSVRANSGATVGYTHVTITGSRFTGTPEVVFGSTAASNVRVLSSHTLIAYAPGHRHGTVQVRVRTKAGTSPRSDKDRYTYVHQVAPGTWQAQTAPVPPGEPADDHVGAVTSCPTTTVCYSVGSFGPAGSDGDDASGSAPLITTRISGVVTTQRAPLPPGVDQSSLYRISCPAVGSCAAAGTYNDGLNGLLLVLADGTWTASTVDLDASTGNAQIEGLSCGAPGDCVVIAHSMAVYRLHDGTWTRIQVAPPGWHPGQPLRSYLEGLDCASATYCLISGAYDKGSKVFVDQLDNGKQSVRPMPTSPRDGQPTRADAVQCPAVDRCTVLTAFADADTPRGKDGSDFVTVRNGSSFAFRPIVLPADADPLSLFAVDGSMSCPEVSVCYAANSYEAGGNVAAVARLDHAKVHLYDLPRPGDPREQVFMNDLDCATATACTAVGAADVVSKVQPYKYDGAYFTFADGVWTTDVARTAPGQHDEPTSTFYDSVDCPAAGSCTADGYYQWDVEPFTDEDGSVSYAYQKDSGLVSIETPS